MRATPVFARMAGSYSARFTFAAETIDAVRIRGNTQAMTAQLNKNWWWLPAKEWAAG